MVDTLRADALGSYAGGDVGTPRLDALAREGVVFENVVAPSSWTKTSMASIVTSLRPDRHGVRVEEDTLPRELQTVAEAFQDAGYETLGVNTNPWLMPRFQFEAGFDRYDSDKLEADALIDHALSKLDGSRPTFLYLHFMDVHPPYDPAPASFDAPPLELPGRGAVADAELERMYRRSELDGPEVRARASALYAATVRELDAALGSLLDRLAERGFLDDAVVLVTSDHGEAFGEHGTPVHGFNLYPEVIRVPLIVRAPGRMPAGARVFGWVSSLDVAPTLLALAGLPIPDEFEGRSLHPLAEARAGQRPAISVVGGHQTAPDRDYVGVVWEDHLYIRDRASGAVELYDLATDPGATRDLGGDDPIAARLAALVGEAAPSAVPTTEIDAALREALEHLGYLEGAR